MKHYVRRDAAARDDLEAVLSSVEEHVARLRTAFLSVRVCRAEEDRARSQRILEVALPGIGEEECRAAD